MRSLRSLVLDSGNFAPAGDEQVFGAMHGERDGSEKEHSKGKHPEMDERVDVAVAGVGRRISDGDGLTDHEFRWRRGEARGDRPLLAVRGAIGEDGGPGGFALCVSFGIESDDGSGGACAASEEMYCCPGGQACEEKKEQADPEQEAALSRNGRGCLFGSHLAAMIA